MSMKTQKQGLLSLPAELRNEIWRLCLKLEDDILVTVSERASFFCDRPTRIAPALLQVNRQIYWETRAILYGENTFTIGLHEGSCMRNIKKEKLDHMTCAIPSLWKEDFRPFIYQISRMQIVVLLGQENPDPGLSAEQEAARLRGNKERFSIVKSAIVELYDWLKFSPSLKDLTIKLSGCEESSERDSQQHQILTPLMDLEGLREVEIFGVPENFARNLKTKMERGGVNHRKHVSGKFSCLGVSARVRTRDHWQGRFL